MTAKTPATASAAKAAAKSTAATTKAAAKKSTAKKAAASTTGTRTAPASGDVPPAAAPVAAADPSGAQPEDSKSATSIAQDILNGSRLYGTGRDRVALLKKAGHDSDQVLKELSRLRAKARRDANR